MFDIIIRGGMLIDGTGSPARRADVGIRGSRVAALDDLSAAEAAQTIDAVGMVVAPGFIDIHSHGDTVLPFLPTADSKIHQGITLEVVGNCGSSMAPLSEDMRAELNREQQFDIPDSVDWLTFGEFANRLRRQGTSLNVGLLVGQGVIRKKVMGMTDDAPTPLQMDAMRGEVRLAMENGALGLSSGLIYTPSVYASPTEIIELARAAAELGGIYTSHIRGEANTLLEAIDEAVNLARATGMPVEISHLKASGMQNWYKMPLAIEKIEQARAEGLDVAADMYPYNASCTDLSSLIPDWAHVGGRDVMLARLADPAQRARLHDELDDHLAVNGVEWDAIFISDCAAIPEYQGRHIADLAAERRQHPWDAVMDILIETHLNVEMIQFTMHAENVSLGLQYEQVSICTDASGRAAEGPFSLGKPHPRHYGSFPRVLGYYTREQKLFPLEEAVRKMSGLPASRLGLSERGLLRAGNFADVVVFDPQTIADRSTFTDPHRYPAGIPWVLVNGQVVIANGRHTGALPGAVLTR